MTFQIRDRLWLMAVVGVHLAGRAVAFGIGLGACYVVPVLVTLVACVGWAVWRSPPLTWLAGLLLGLSVALLSSTELLLEVAYGLGRMRYWDWAQDWPIAAVVLASYSTLGGILGAATVLVARSFGPQGQEKEAM
jgi:hypothetical protein